MTRVPPLHGAGLVRGWGAVDGYSPDGAPVLGAAPGVDGLYLAVAASGVDLTPFRPSRFADGAAISSDTDCARPDWRNTPV